MGYTARMATRALLAFAVASIAIGASLPGCSSESSAEPAKVGPFEAKVGWPHLSCDPIAPTYCGFPFPSNVWTVDATDTPTKRRVQLDDATLPVSLRGEQTTGGPWSKSDGFSASAGIVTQLPVPITEDGVARLDDMGRSLAADSPTVILDADTGERIAHFAEIDRTRGDVDTHSFVLRPAAALPDGHRIIVALRKLRGTDGAEVAPSPAFRALRDLVASDEPSVDARRGLYEDIFGKLAAAGIPRADLQLAWDFTTASRENVTGWLLHMRDEALASFGEQGPAYVIDEVDEASDTERVAYRIKAHMTNVPLYLDKPEPGGKLVFGPDGMPMPNPMRPTYDVPVEILIPKSALAKPASLLQYGHGLLGSRDQIGSDALRQVANDKNHVFFGIDLVGMAEDDSSWITNVLGSGRMHDLAPMFDRLHQGFLNSLLAMRMMSGGFAKDPKYGALIDPTQRYYYGISQGGIMGAVYMSVSTDVTRGVLEVMGQPYTFLLNRSVDFTPFFLVLRGSYPDARDQQFSLAMLQMLWDRVEPSGYTKYLRSGLPNTPPHEVLMRAALGDHQVTTWGAHVMARSVGAKHLETGVRDVYGLSKASQTTDGSVYAEYDFGLPTEPLCNVPMTYCEDPHGLVRRLPGAADQLDRFLRGGEGVNACPNSVCKFPEQSGCTTTTFPDVCTAE
jgi:hypothetical protein